MFTVNDLVYIAMTSLDFKQKYENKIRFFIKALHIALDCYHFFNSCYICSS